VIAAFWLMFADAVPHRWFRGSLYDRVEWVDAVGVTLTAAGVALAIWARVFLGGNWSGSVTVKVGHELIRGGPYRFVRHPIYTGFLTAMLGTAVVRGEVRGVLAFAMLFAGFWLKLGMEEGFMRKTFGAQYDEYARTTGVLLPRFRN
jgi:protein-S-isoprenylcysteine O-methyltransferase Ste14